MILRFLAAALVLGGLLGLPATSPARAADTPLTDAQVESIVEVLEIWKAKFDTNKRLAQQQGGMAVLQEHGFGDTDTWAKTYRKVGLAYAAGELTAAQRDDVRRQIETARQQMAESGMPEAQQNAVIDRMKSRLAAIENVPPADIAAVEPYRARLDKIFKTEAPQKR